MTKLAFLASAATFGLLSLLSGVDSYPNAVSNCNFNEVITGDYAAHTDLNFTIDTVPQVYLNSSGFATLSFRLNVGNGAYQGIVFSAFAKNGAKYTPVGTVIPPADHNLASSRDSCGSSSVQHKSSGSRTTPAIFQVVVNQTMLFGLTSNALILEVMVANNMQNYGYTLRSSSPYQTLVRAYSASAPANPSLSPLPSPPAAANGVPVCLNANVCVLVAADASGNQNKIKVSITGKVGQYAAIGWGSSSMTNADMAIAWFSGSTGVISDRYATGHTTPTADANQDMVIIPAETKLNSDGTTWVVTFSKTLSNSADPQNDKAWPTTAAYFIWAYGTSPSSTSSSASLSQHVAGSFGVKMVTLYPGSNSSTPSPSPTTSPSGTGNSGTAGYAFCTSGNAFCVKATKLDSSTAQITFAVADKTQYAAFGIGSGMADADIWVAWVSGQTVVVSDRYSSGYSTPTVDATQNLVLISASSSVSSSGAWTATFNRTLKASDTSADKDIVEASASYIWAIGTSPASSSSSANFDYHGPDSRGIATINIFSTTTGSVGGSNGTNNTDNGADTTTGTCFTGSPFCLKVSKSTTDSTLAVLTFTVSDTTKYVSWGIGKSMSDADVVILWVSGGKVIVSDRYTSSRAIPTADSSNDYVITSSSVDETTGKWVAVLTRPLKAPEATADKDITDGSASYIWAYGTAPSSSDSTTSSISYHTGRGIYNAQIFSASAVSSSSDVYNLLVVVHSAMMFIAWGIFCPAAIFMARYLKDHMGVWWFRLHKALFIGVNVLTIIAFSVIIAKFVLLTQASFVDLHQILGLIVIILMMAQSILGHISDKKWSPERTSIPWWDKAHWWLGRLVGVSALTIMGYAVVVYTNYISVGVMVAFWIWEALVIVAFIVGEVKLGVRHHLATPDKTVDVMSQTKSVGVKNDHPYIGSTNSPYYAY